MRIPNADRAVIDPLKLHGYLLSQGDPVGRFKAGFFVALGSGSSTRFGRRSWGPHDARQRLSACGSSLQTKTSPGS